MTRPQVTRSLPVRPGRSARPLVTVRPVDETLAESLTDLWVASRVESGGSSEAALRVASTGTVSGLLRRPEVTVLAAVADEEPVGFLLLQDTLAGSFIESPCTVIEQLFVAARWRRHGVARQLLAATAVHAERVGAESIVSHVPSQGREANRFFARLGFAPAVVRRVTTPTALHRKLAASADVPVLSRVGLEEVIQRRRSARLRAVRQGAAPRPVDA